jgi:glycosyltransferase involved in cell wall biosynthesis
MKISVAVITFNEENNIERCLKSVALLADEIIVVDSLSTDKTVDLAKVNGAKVVSQKFLGYIEQKNFAIQQCANDWVLSLDADECLSDDLQKEILQLKNNNHQPDGYIMPRLSRYCGQWIKHGAWYPDKKVRLFNRAVAKWGGINPHDKIFFTNEHPIITQLNGDILHYTINTKEEHQQQAKRFSEITAKELFNQQKSTNVFKIYLKPIVRFIRDYFFKAGFLDGKAGLQIAIISAHHVYLRENNLKELIQSSKP